VADSSTLERAAARGLHPETFLRENDSYTFFDALGDLIRTGPTRTNVGDVQITLVG
jgi:hydroxypyruvate reductase